MGAHGGYIGNAMGQQAWIHDLVEGWVAGIKELAKMATQYPQVAYAGLQCLLQNKWLFIQ